MSVFYQHVMSFMHKDVPDITFRITYPDNLPYDAMVSMCTGLSKNDKVTNIRSTKEPTATQRIHDELFPFEAKP